MGLSALIGGIWTGLGLDDPQAVSMAAMSIPKIQRDATSIFIS
jgi:hypothetical protein